MIKQQLETDLKQAVSSLGYEVTDIVCDISKNPEFGDYVTNIALQLSKQKSRFGNHSAEEIAKDILQKLGSPDYLERTESAGPGFINFFIKNDILLENLKTAGELKNHKNHNQILIEYGHVNPLKEIHIGHLRTFILGESLARILESLGNKVFRANYQGDIGLHIAKAIWGIRKIGLPSTELSLEEKAKFMGRSYAEGVKDYEENPTAQTEIDRITKALYEKSDPDLMEIYKLAREWSLDYFTPIYRLLDVKYDQCFFESEVYEEGECVVLENIDKVFIKDNGAVIFPGEKYGLHNRVFITSQGNPTYEAKEIGLAKAEYDRFPYDLSIHVVASEQAGYFEVVIKAIEMLFPNLKGKKYHLSYGLVDLKQGKMSSRTGNVVTVDDLLGIVAEKVRQVMKESRLEVDQEVVNKVALGAIKFSYLKYSPEPNMVFDLEQSVSLNGDSGPYLQYTHARIKSVLEKAGQGKAGVNLKGVDLNSQERRLLQQILYFPEVVNKAAASYHPNLLAEYLINLARFYNSFYQENRIIGSSHEKLRLEISVGVSKILQAGLKLLGIEAPERM